MTEPFRFPDLYWLDLTRKIGDRSLRDYDAIFEKRRIERPGGAFADEDIQELMHLAEDVESVDASETKYLLDLVNTHPDYFRDVAQRGQLETFARTHEAVMASRKDEF